MMTSDHDINLIIATVHLYFQGTYHGDSVLLKRAFHENVHITGTINHQVYDWTLTEFIDRVTVKPTAFEKSEKYDKQIILIDATQDTAIVKARVIIGPLVFTDYITLTKMTDRWVIRHKSFTSLPL